MGPSLIHIDHARAIQAERRHPAARPARTGRRLPALPAVVAVAFVAFAFAVLASTASAREIDAPGTPQVARQVATPAHTSSPAPSGGISTATAIALVAGAAVIVGGGSWLANAVGWRGVPPHVR
jgi:2-keto-3-deoxy-6-phosphogluconate aldolase